MLGLSLWRHQGQSHALYRCICDDVKDPGPAAAVSIVSARCSYLTKNNVGQSVYQLPVGIRKRQILWHASLLKRTACNCYSQHAHAVGFRACADRNSSVIAGTGAKQQPQLCPQCLVTAVAATTKRLLWDIFLVPDVVSGKNPSSECYVKHDDGWSVGL